MMNCYSSSKALKMEAGFMSREMVYQNPMGPAAMLESPVSPRSRTLVETSTPPPASRLNTGVRPMSISTSSNHSDSRTPPAAVIQEDTESIQNQLTNIAHSLLHKQTIRVNQLMSLHNEKEVRLKKKFK